MEKVLSLKTQWENFKTANPKVRIRDAAKQLNTTEAELVATTATSLTNNFATILQEVENLGKVMALTRNNNCVHERKGIYHNVTFTGSMGLAVNPDIDLRLFMNQWEFAFAVNENERKSLQFFAKNGEAVHKIYLTENSNVAAYDALVVNHTNVNLQMPVVVNNATKPATEKPDQEINVVDFEKDWLALKDTHDFFILLKKHGLTRTQGLRLAPKGYANQITLPSLIAILNQAVVTDLQIMVFTGNAGCIQIHTGYIKRLVQTGPWFNVLDPDFNLHLNTDEVAAVWLVKKPTVDGIVTSIEVFDTLGNIIVQFFGKRKPGLPELEPWRLITSELAEMV